MRSSQDQLCVRVRVRVRARMLGGARAMLKYEITRYASVVWCCVPHRRGAAATVEEMHGEGLGGGG